MDLEQILRFLQAQAPMPGMVSGTLPADPNYGPVPPPMKPQPARPSMGGYMAPPMPPASVPPQAPAPAGLLSAPPSPGAAPPAGPMPPQAPQGLLGAPQPLGPMMGAPQPVSPLVSGGGLPEMPSGGLPGAEPEGGGFMAFLQNNPELSRGLMEMGMKMLSASAPSTDPRSGSLGFALGQGVGGFMQGMDTVKEEKRQQRSDAVNEAYKLAIANQAPGVDIQSFYDDATGREFKGYFDQATGEIVRLGGLKAPPKTGGSGGAGPGAIDFGDEKQLRQEYLKSVKDVAPVYDGWQRVKAGANLGSGPGDMSMIFGYMKMLDPGSVVREGEYANARNAAGVPEQLQAEYNRLIGGGVLSEEQRRQFLAAAKAAWSPYQARLEDTQRIYGGLATTYGMDPARITIDPVPAVVAAEVPTASDLEVGDVVDDYRYIGGDPGDESSWEPE